MDLEFHQLDRRYEALRKRDPRKEGQLLASLAEHGQLLPVVVVAADERFILVDGYKRLRALTRLAQDRVCAMRWEIDEPEALILEQLMRAADPVGPLEQGWVLDALQTRFGLALADLARRFDKTASWVSRRLALVRDLPELIHGEVRAGRLAPHAAMKYLVPLARANQADCVRLVEAITAHRLTTRQIGRLYQVYVTPRAVARSGADRSLARAAGHRRHAARPRPSRSLGARSVADRSPHPRRGRAPGASSPPARGRAAAARAGARLAALRPGADGLSRSRTAL
jgi:hypothetical protein